MRASWMIACVLVAGCASQHGSSPADVANAVADAGSSASPLGRQYVEGEAIRYVMTGTNQGRERTLQYTAEAEARVLRDEQGRFIEEVRWTRLTFGGQEIPLDEGERELSPARVA